jgi:hypothetical protein
MYDMYAHSPDDIPGMFPSSLVREMDELASRKPNKYGPKPIPVIFRLLKKVKFPEDEDGCWEWRGAKDKRGYGRIGTGTWKNVKTLLPHRLLYTYYYGSVPRRLVLDHLCCNPACVRPSHLEPVTQQENMRRAWVRLGLKELGHG